MSRHNTTGTPSQLPETFIDLLVSGRVLLDDVDDFVSEWHSAAGNSPAACLRLNEYLGITSGEYQLWAERPEALRFIATAHRDGLAIADVLRQASGVAARASEQSEARKLLEWLEKTGRVKPEDLDW
jgi:hypothetical protein